MSEKIRKEFCIIAIFLLSILPASTIFGQVTVEDDSLKIIPDTLDYSLGKESLLIQVPEIEFDTDQAIEYLSIWYENDSWNSKEHPLRKTIERLLFEATNDPLYLSNDFIREYDWEKIKIPASSFYMYDTLHIPIPVRTKTGYTLRSKRIIDPLITDTLRIRRDTTGLNIRQDSVYYFQDDTVSNPEPEDLRNIFVQDNDNMTDQTEMITHDSIILVISDTLREVISSNPDFPFSYYDYPFVGDSIQSAVLALRDYINKTDSSRLAVRGSNSTIPLWLSNNSTTMKRLWLKNEWDEEVSIWIGSYARDSVDIIVERGVHFRRPNKTTNIADAKIGIQTVDNSKLAEAKEIDVKPQYWKFLSEASFVFNQAMIKNWAKGGESNISTLLDVTGTANYTNKEKKMVWDNQARVKFGLITASNDGNMQIRKNVDQVDIVSKFNHKAFGKFDFSSTMLFKTQIANGYKYPNDSVVVSKFFNPASITLGLGLDYKPNKNTSINFAPLSYKATFVPDTANIDPTKHGLKANQRSRHEPGLSAQISHKATIFEDINIVNKVRLFTNYIDNPQNIDIDWELIATAKLNWFTDLRLNTHLIYDDDTLIPVKDEDGEQVNNPDGSPKKVPMVQFKELIGVSIIFRF